MATRMIPVRHKLTGQTTEVGESAWPHFAGAYERLDLPVVEEPSKRPARQATSEKEK